MIGGSGQVTISPPAAAAAGASQRPQEPDRGRLPQELTSRQSHSHSREQGADPRARSVVVDFYLHRLGDALPEHFLEGADEGVLAFGKNPIRHRINLAC